MTQDTRHLIIRRSVPCYFCNEFLEERYLPEHIKHCGAILEECPHKCGAYVQRRSVEEHAVNCGRAITRNSRRRSKETRETQDHLWKEKVFLILSLLRNAVDNGERERKRLQEVLSVNLSALRNTQDSLATLKLQFIDVIEKIRSSNAEYDARLKDLELTCSGIEQCTRLNIQQISEQLKSFQHELIDQRRKDDKALNDWLNFELKELKTFVARESVLNGTSRQEQLQRINDLKLELEMRCKDSKALAEKQDAMTNKTNELAREIKGNSESIAKQLEDLKETKLKLQEDIRRVEELIKENSMVELPETPICSCEKDPSAWPVPAATNGRLLWRIDRYKEKMTNAKETDSVLYSPAFYNKEYGYTLRMELFLNGRGQWKDRHVIGCLRVEEGQWDTLLDWPCILRATVVLRDQENPANDVRKIVKTVKWRHNSDSEQKPDKDSGIYTFIPHTTLTRHASYTKNNAMFLDIQIKDIQTSVSTPSLAV